MARADWHKRIRDAVAAQVGGAVAGYTVHALDDPETDLPRVANLPAIIVACVGPEQRRPEFDTNQRDGIGYPVAVMLVGTGVTGAAGSKGSLPDLTLFRSAVWERFQQKRLTGVAEVGYCEVSDSGPLYDKDSPMFQKLQTALVVLACGRFPRS